MNSGAAPSFPTRASNAIYWSGLALIGAAAAAGLAEPLCTLFRYVPLDPNEGWNAYFQQIAMRGGDLYPAPGSAIVNNYPPLSFYIVGILGRLVGDDIFAGRLVALASMLIVAGNLYLWLRASGSENRVAWLGAGVFAAFAVSYAGSYAGINDPQWLAHAIMTTGLVVIWRGNASTRAIALGALLMLAGGWTKHLLIPLPIAATWWLMRRSKSALMTWIAWSALLLTVSGLLVWWLYGGEFFESLRSAREYSLHQAIVRTRRALRVFAPIVGLSLLLAPRIRGNDRMEFAAAYLLAAALVAAVASGGIGVDINAFFDLMIALSLCAALSVEALWRRRLPGSLSAIEAGPALSLLLGAYLCTYAASLAPSALRHLRGIDALERQTLAATRLIVQTAHGRAACETLELCYWAKSEFMFDFFNYGQRLKVGKQPLAACASLFDGRDIPLIQLDSNDGSGSKQLPPACNGIIRQNYRPISTSAVGVILTSAP